MLGKQIASEWRLYPQTSTTLPQGGLLQAQADYVEVWPLSEASEVQTSGISFKDGHLWTWTIFSDGAIDGSFVCLRFQHSWTMTLLRPSGCPPGCTRMGQRIDWWKALLLSGKTLTHRFSEGCPWYTSLLLDQLLGDLLFPPAHSLHLLLHSNGPSFSQSVGGIQGWTV